MNKVDRALELRVIDWLQWGEFEENLLKNPDGSDMAQLTLELISKRKKLCNELQKQNEILREALQDLILDIETPMRLGLGTVNPEWKGYLAAKQALEKIKEQK